MTNPISRWWKHKKEQIHRQDIETVRSRIQLEYRDNQVWLTCDGTAFACLSPEMTTEQITETIEGCRRAAIAYRYHVPVGEDTELEAVLVLDPPSSCSNWQL